MFALVGLLGRWMRGLGGQQRCVCVHICSEEGCLWGQQQHVHRHAAGCVVVVPLGGRVGGCSCCCRQAWLRACCPRSSCICQVWGVFEPAVLSQQFAPGFNGCLANVNTTTTHTCVLFTAACVCRCACVCAGGVSSSVLLSTWVCEWGGTMGV